VPVDDIHPAASHGLIDVDELRVAVGEHLHGGVVRAHGNPAVDLEQLKEGIRNTLANFPPTATAQKNGNNTLIVWRLDLMNAPKDCCSLHPADSDDRRKFLRSSLGFLAIGAMGELALGVPGVSFAAALSKEDRDKLTPDQIIDMMKQGNERFRTGKPQGHDYLAQKRASAAGQYPAAVILSCVDSRAPAEIILDMGIGDTFNTRVAGNISNDDVLGSLEFSCAAAGAKVILVMGHTACGAIKGAIDGVKLGNLTGLLDKIKPAVQATQYSGERSSKNNAFVDEVAKTNVRLTMDAIRRRSEVLAGLEKDGKIKIAGSMYNLVGGRVEFLT
jgi:carbonic anhydrase